MTHLRNRHRPPRLCALAAACAAALAWTAPAAAEPPVGDFLIAPVEPVYRVAPVFDPSGLITGLECGAVSGFAKGKLRAGCVLARRDDDFRAKAGGRFKLDLDRRDGGTRIKVRLTLDGWVKEPGERRVGLRIVIKGATVIPAGASVAVVPLATKGCTGSFCERGKATLLVPLVSADADWRLLLSLGAVDGSAVAGSARLLFGDGSSLALDVVGAFDPARDRSSLILVPVVDLPGTALSIAKLRQKRDGGWVGKLRYALYGQKDSVKIAVGRIP